jgi:hypothetical protein
MKSYDLSRGSHDDYLGSLSSLSLKYQDNPTNAYMLVYVRETERDAIMNDSLALDQ